MRFWGIGCAAALLAIAGCGKDATTTTDGKSGSTATGDKSSFDKLKIDDTKVGSGPAAKNGDTLMVEYTGKLSDGTEFDSSASRNDEPFGFVLGDGKVIKGWDQGMIGMKEGGQRRLSIPYALAYGEAGKPPTIPAKADLIFDVKLDKVIDAEDLHDVSVQIVKKGSGPKIKQGQMVQVLYIGKFFNGKTFDTNREPKPNPLPVLVGSHSVIPGFDKALEGMQAGERRIATIPPIWGYGFQGQGAIPKNSWLVFDIEVVSIKK